MDRVEGKTSSSEKGGALTIELLRKKKMAIHINVVQGRCNRSVERSRYAESLSDEREQ
jgi:hypothetical protein